MSALVGHTELMLTTIACTFAAVLTLWVVSVARRNAALIDPFWGPGFVLIAAVACAAGDGFAARRVLIAAMTAVWGARLGGHLLARYLQEAEEDRRYAAMRAYWGASFWWVSLGTVFLLQGTLMWIISLPIQVVAVAAQPTALGTYDAFAVAVWGVGMFFEAIGDAQLRAFKSNPDSRGKVLDTGLWAYTRHPNYFGNALVWWGIYLVALGVPGGWLTVFSPAIMTFLLLKVSGVAMLERDIAERRPGYRDYILRTSAFLPRHPLPRQPLPRHPLPRQPLPRRAPSAETGPGS